VPSYLHVCGLQEVRLVDTLADEFSTTRKVKIQADKKMYSGLSDLEVAEQIYDLLIPRGFTNVIVEVETDE